MIEQRTMTQSWWKRGYGWELLAAFVTGVVLMQFIHLDSRGFTGDRVGLPGFDAWYHVKMAELLPEIGFVREFPWLRHVYFREEGRDFVSHHAGFHVFLAPFVAVSKALTGDPAVGGRWAISLSFGLSLMLMQLLLMIGRVPWRWVFLLVFLLFPSDFFLRHSYVRAISPSLVLMLALLVFLFLRRPLWAGVTIALYNLLYLGAVMFSPVIVVVFVAASLAGPKEDRRVEWKTALATLTGWVAGVLLYPYREGMLEFLRLQVFGSGLTPDISVGKEWNSYGNVWEFAVESCGPLLAAWATAVTLRLRFGPRLSARDTTLLVLQFGYLLLTLKAQRFIEYWPPMCLLSAAYLSAPVLTRLSQWMSEAAARRGPAVRSAMLAAGVLGFAGLSIIAAWRGRATLAQNPVLRDWAVWCAAAGLFLLSALRVGGAVAATGGRREWVVPLLGAGFCAGCAGLAKFVFAVDVTATGKLVSPLLAGGVVMAAFLLSGVSRRRRSVEAEAVADVVAPTFARRAGRTIFTLSALTLAISLTASRLAYAYRASDCRYDVPAVRNVMNALKEASQPGDVVFTDDWDVFPAYFYFNSHNHYIVGLDPKFTQWRDPELWARYVKISRGETRDPDVTVAVKNESGAYVNKDIHVRLEDIRDLFGCRFVVTDRDHQGLSRLLSERPDLAELIYPPTEYKQAKDAPYLLFRILDGEPETSSPAAPAPGAQVVSKKGGRTRLRVVEAP